MSESESSESEPEFESIIATRARRSNAGSRLRQLLDLEETNNGPVSINDDDENVNLLFMEDEDDGEFQDSEDEEQKDGDEDEDEDEEEEVDVEAELNKTPREKKKTTDDSGNTSEEEKDLPNVDADEMLSDSDISASDDDESEGEKELQKQEQLNRRRKRKASLPAVLQKKKPKVASSKDSTKAASKLATKSHRSNIFDSVPIAPYERRHSARRTTLQNSMATHEKMEKEYEKRQTQAPVVSKEYVEKTLEERLEEAKITEKENTLSLTRFYEQEIQKKKKQRDLANSRKFKMRNFIRFWSTGIFITPLDEVRLIEEEERRLKEEEENKNRRKLQYLKRKQARLAKTGSSSPIKTNTKEQSEIDLIANKIKDDEDKKVTSAIELKQETEVNPVRKEEITTAESVDENTPTNAVQFSEVSIPLTDEQKISNDAESNPVDTTEKKFKEVELETTDIPLKELSLGGSFDESMKETSTLEGVKREGNGKTDNEDENTQEDNVNESEVICDTPKLQFEGPAQHVARNYVIFEEFDHEVTSDGIKRYLFGQQAAIKGTHHDPQYETLCVIKQDESSNIDLHKIQAMREESFKSLIQLPKFGEKITAIDDGNEQLEEDENEVVQIHTPAPVGIHLPNGQKKICPTSGLPAMYYDPTNGVPYATVDAFRVLKSIVEGDYEWLQLDHGGINSRFKGGIGCYISKKNQRHAAGVPEGFS